MSRIFFSRIEHDLKMKFETQWEQEKGIENVKLIDFETHFCNKNIIRRRSNLMLTKLQ